MDIACGFEPERTESRHIDPAPATKVQSVQIHPTKPHLNSANPLSAESPPPVDLNSWVPYSFKVLIERSCSFPGVNTEITVWSVGGQDNTRPRRKVQQNVQFSRRNRTSREPLQCHCRWVCGHWNSEKKNIVYAQFTCREDVSYGWVSTCDSKGQNLWVCLLSFLPIQAKLIVFDRPCTCLV
jgi:hypothetical protein